MKNHMAMQKAKNGNIKLGSGIAVCFLGVLAILVAPAIAQEEKKDAFVCMEDTQEKCDYENRNLQLFVQGRDAFDRGRESGDLTEARSIARELIDRGDEKHGGALMKFIHLQFGQGTHKNLVQAYRWVSADIAAGAKYRRLNLERVQEQLAAKMTPEQLAEAKK